MTDPIVLKFSRTDLPKFLLAVDAIITDAINAFDTDNPKKLPSYATNLSVWQKKGLMAIKTRPSFQKIILQWNKTLKGETPSETMDKCVKEIKKN